MGDLGGQFVAATALSPFHRPHVRTEIGSGVRGGTGIDR